MGTVKALDWLHEKGKQELEAGDYDKARQRFNKIANMTRDSDWVRKANASLAEVYLEEDNLFWAMDHIRRALKRAPHHSHYHYLKGSIHLRRKEWSQAADAGVKAVEDNPDNGAYYFLLAKAVYKSEGYDEASKFLDWCIECEPDNVEIQLDVAGIEIEQGHFQEALQILERALDNASDKKLIRQKMRAIQENWEISGS